LGSSCAIAAPKMLVQLTSGVHFINKLELLFLKNRMRTLILPLIVWQTAHKFANYCAI